MLANPFDVVHDRFSSPAFRGANAAKLLQPAYGEPGIQKPLSVITGFRALSHSLCLDGAKAPIRVLEPRNDESGRRGQRTALFRRLGRGARRIPRLVSGGLFLHPADPPDRGLI